MSSLTRLLDSAQKKMEHRTLFPLQTELLNRIAAAFGISYFSPLWKDPHLATEADPMILDLMMELQIKTIHKEVIM